MLVAGLTGGIGSGKSTFAALLAEHGAQIIDADQLGRDALQPGQPAWDSVVTQFGDEILAAHSMQVDRKRLASIVFNDKDALAALNAIIHPVIFGGIADALERLRDTDSIVVIDAALILEAGLDSILDTLIVVTSTKENRRSRLQSERGMSVEEIDARIANQLRQEDLVAKADIVVENDGSLEDLAAEAERVFKLLEGKQRA